MVYQTKDPNKGEMKAYLNEHNGTMGSVLAHMVIHAEQLKKLLGETPIDKKAVEFECKEARNAENLYLRMVARVHNFGVDKLTDDLKLQSSSLNEAYKEIEGMIHSVEQACKDTNAHLKTRPGDDW